MRRAGEGPVVQRTVAARLEDVGAIRPSLDRDPRRTDVAIGNSHQCKAGKPIVEDNAELLFNSLVRAPAQHMARPRTMHVVHWIAVLVEKEKAVYELALGKSQRLARLELSKRLDLAPLPHQNTAVQSPVEFQDQHRVTDLHHWLGGRSKARRCAGETRTGNRPGEQLEHGSPARHARVSLVHSTFSYRPLPPDQLDQLHSQLATDDSCSALKALDRGAAIIRIQQAVN